MISRPYLDSRAATAGDRPVMVGHAIVWDAWTTIHESPHYEMREVVRRGAARNALAEGQDVRMLFNHDSNYVLGRTTSGTLRLFEDPTGLWTETDAPDTPTIRDLVLAPIARRDVSGMSFSFTARPGGERVTVEDRGGRIVEHRELLDLDLYDVSAVTYPAYKQTDVNVRARTARDVTLRRMAERMGRAFAGLASTLTIERNRPMRVEQATGRGTRDVLPHFRARLEGKLTPRERAVVEAEIRHLEGGNPATREEIDARAREIRRAEVGKALASNN